LQRRDAVAELVACVPLPRPFHRKQSLPAVDDALLDHRLDVLPLGVHRGQLLHGPALGDVRHGRFHLPALFHEVVPGLPRHPIWQIDHRLIFRFLSGSITVLYG
jgi:hypothetical protein